ncbi:hypothetical protein KKC1_06040 [Calderihabitans maritimus]|uniref:Uncharacterized protein n=1 Tax=Calderihabitans maritimus TaxID=1246530 RepID=A0A1Z5HPI3_9FIRM|nr:hypothetical protein KKC1_06040 [Calderihabitans maritimus]
MTILFVIGLLLIFTFSFSLAWYLSYYRIPVQSRVFRTIGLLVLGTFIFLTTTLLTLIVIWPPIA